MIKFSDYFYYDETSPSCLRWKVNIYSGRGRNIEMATVDEPAGSLCPNGYYVVGLKGRQYRVHRVVWEMINSSIPLGMEVDHKNGARSDNKIDNLRCVPRVVNARNRSKRKKSATGVTGVYFQIKDKREYCIAVWHKDGKQVAKYFSVKNLGRGMAFEEACKARREAIKELNETGAGYTERHGT